MCVDISRRVGCLRVYYVSVNAHINVSMILIFVMLSILCAYLDICVHNFVVCMLRVHVACVCEHCLAGRPSERGVSSSVGVF